MRDYSDGLLANHIDHDNNTIPIRMQQIMTIQTAKTFMNRIALMISRPVLKILHAGKGWAVSQQF